MEARKTMMIITTTRHLSNNDLPVYRNRFGSPIMNYTLTQGCIYASKQQSNLHPGIYIYS